MCVWGGTKTFSVDLSLLETYIDSHINITLAKVVQNTGFIQDSQVSHVTGLMELRRVHLLHIILLYSDGLESRTHILLQRKGTLAAFLSEAKVELCLKARVYGPEDIFVTH